MESERNRSNRQVVLSMTEHRKLARTLAVTGTDTGIGKTVVSCALATVARRRGIEVAAMKPVESGIEARFAPDGQQFPSDADRLMRASGADVSLDIVRPYGFVEPLAPFMAAKRQGVEIDIGVLDDAHERLSSERDLLIVEGAGGLLVPLSEQLSFAQLFARWNSELVIVAGNRLGVLNHLLLTVSAARADRLPIRAVVLTSLTQRDADIAEATNYDALRILLENTPLYRFPWIDRVDDADSLAIACETSGLDEILNESTAQTPELIRG
jgi:dethiobiotin synthetase